MTTGADHARSYAAAESEWVDDLRARGVKAAHPDDGWVDRTANKVHFCYPQFDLNPQEGDLVALGNHKHYRLVRVTEVRRWRHALNPDPHQNQDYLFEEVRDA